MSRYLPPTCVVRVHYSWEAARGETLGRPIAGCNGTESFLNGTSAHDSLWVIDELVRSFASVGVLRRRSKGSSTYLTYLRDRP